MTTPTPYKMTIAQPGTMHEIVNEQGEYVCSLLGNNSDEEKQANAAFIITACNSHAALVEALQILLDHAEERFPHFEDTRGQTDIERAREALRMAQG